MQNKNCPKKANFGKALQNGLYFEEKWYECRKVIIIYSLKLKHQKISRKSWWAHASNN